MPDAGVLLLERRIISPARCRFKSPAYPRKHQCDHHPDAI
jgi:hypothetical protein